MNAPKTKWSLEDENTLIELVEKYESKGKSKQEAFEMVANIINRTKTACASRYRKLSKDQFREMNKPKDVTKLNKPINPPSLNIELVIQFLMNFEQKHPAMEEIMKLKERVAKLKIDNENLNRQIVNLKTLIQKKQNVLINLTE
ncbi:SANT/Myb-like DNA-binding domain-containing protein [Gottfriedia acidiceleris]|uniref:SANT/Myb-like DNA-binding domain-containing protein n=1 Tax=Gottfriedia acidiceleris TaxID=371036 RepID=A0ABY4JRK7_9BACI|nr:SANT/Myb-like DNA-binding domain-containing protein [Gottfriedia acidiceleris]UPM55307.1 SANT/Myb-like DNA-binding domain-containing protein [Gottfriedia acidiceleris]